MLISGFDHVVIAVRDLAAGVAAYETLLGRIVVEQVERDGVGSAFIVTDNIAVELMAPAGDGEMAQRLRAVLEEGEGLKSLVFATGDIERAHRRCERVGLAPGPINRREGAPASFRADDKQTHGVRVFLVEADPARGRDEPGDGAVLGLDHVVIRTRDVERAAALYGARLGLDMRLDREVAGRRLMFFRCGDAIVEVAQDASVETDQLWGLSWRVAEAGVARERLHKAGLDVSEVRSGFKPGTRVFTVRDRTCGVPTLMLEAAPKPG